MKDYRVYLAQNFERIGRVEEFTKVCIRKEEGTTSVQYFKQADGAVMLDPDVKTHFPDSDSVNKALRSLIARR
jgi:hypothetical protein